SRQTTKLQPLLALAQQRHIKVRQVSRRELDQQLGDVNHQGIAASVHYPEQKYDEADVINWIEQADKPIFLLILDGVQDPHNLGACLRTADAAGVTAVVAPKDKSVSLTPTVRKVACGAAESLPFVQVTNLARFLKQIKQLGVWCYGLAGEANKTIYDMDLKGNIAIIMGAEGSGLRQLTRECCDDLLSIPMAGMVSSVNVSVATGITLFEAVRQRM
ncbi:MAG: 23S rRNA (guanosine(2251)-2'-O)-methyltransferase RlmB, partial [Gammaproteobacteria bacterium]